MITLEHWNIGTGPLTAIQTESRRPQLPNWSSGPIRTGMGNTQNAQQVTLRSIGDSWRVYDGLCICYHIFTYPSFTDKLQGWCGLSYGCASRCPHCALPSIDCRLLGRIESDRNEMPKLENISMLARTLSVLHILLRKAPPSNRLPKGVCGHFHGRLAKAKFTAINRENRESALKLRRSDLPFQTWEDGITMNHTTKNRATWVISKTQTKQRMETIGDI